MGNRLHLRVKRTKDDIQQCKDCNGNGSMPNPVRPPRLMDCSTCNGQGFIGHRAPYRLADGTWSDGVDRNLRICDQSGSDCDKNRIFVWRYYDFYIKMKHVWIVDRQEPCIDEEFDSWEEAIEYATKKGLQ